MKLKELLLDRMIETSIFEMAYNRKRARELVSGQSYELTNHILKMLIMPQSRDWNHWRAEINGWIRKFQRMKLKQKSRGANERDFKNWMITEPEYDIEGMIRDLENDYKGEKFDVPPNVQLHVHNALTRIAKQIAFGSNETIDIAQHIKGELV